MEELHNLKACLRFAEEIKDKETEGRVCNRIGFLYYSIGRYDKAIDNFEVYLTIAKEKGNKEGEGRAYGNLGACYCSLGQFDKAIKYQEMCLTFAKEIGDKEGEAAAYSNLGTCLMHLGQYNKAIKYQEMFLTVAKEIGDKIGEGTAYGNIGCCYGLLDQYDKAIEYLEMHLTISNEVGDDKGKGAAYGNLGHCYSHLRQHHKAIKFHELLLSTAQEIGDKKGEGVAYGNVGAYYMELGQHNKAITYHKICLSIGKDIGDKIGEGTAYRNLGTCYYTVGIYDKSERNFKKGVECCEELFENAPKWDEDRVSVIDTYIFIYEALIEVLLAQGKIDEALVVAERGRSRALSDLMLTTYPISYGSVTETKISDLHEIRKLVKSLRSTVLFFAMQSHDICTWVIQPNGDVLFVRRHIELSEYVLKSDLLHSVTDLNSLVNKAIELMTSCGAVRCEDRSLSFLYPEKLSKPTQRKRRTGAVRPVNLTFPQSLVSKFNVSHPAPVEDMKIACPTTSVRQGKTEASINPEALMLTFLLKDLYKILLHPVRQYLVRSQAIVVPEGALALVPFSALLDENGNYTAESFQVTIMPSLATAKMIRERPEEPAGRASRPLVVGDPDIGQVKKGKKVIPVPRLEFAKKEVEKVVGPFLGVKPLVGEKATKSRFLQKVESANLIHIAAHGDAERGEILLAPCRRTNICDLEDVMLMISDLEGKRIKAKLVVLSCCYSGRGKVCGEGVVGIARAFLGAGARAVLVTLWAVDDGSTLCFMYRFYEYLTSGDSASEALKKAIKATRELKKFVHPRYWAPFVLLGDDVTPFVRPAKTYESCETHKRVLRMHVYSFYESYSNHKKKKKKRAA